MTGESFLDGKVQLFAGDCLDVLKTLEPSSVDSIVTDPPYGLEFMGKGWDGADGFRRSLNRADAGRDNVFGRASKRGPEYRAGFLFQEFMHAIAIECLRVLKPGAHLVAFGGTRTYHRMACAIEDAGFEIRDSIQWLYGSGFPKSLDVSKAIDKARDEDDAPIRVVCRFLRAAMARKGRVSRDLVKHFDDCHPRLIDHWAARDTDSQPSLPTWPQWLKLKEVLALSDDHDAEVWRLNGRKGEPSDTWKEAEVIGEYDGEPGGFGDHRFSIRDDKIRAPSIEASQWSGFGTALKPACEPIVLARKPLSESTVAANVLRWGTGALNIGASRVAGEDVQGVRHRHGGGVKGAGTSYEMPDSNGAIPPGRWPANVIHDGSDEVVGAFPQADGPGGAVRPESVGTGSGVTYMPTKPQGTIYAGEKGSAARFFYTAKADSDDRLGSKHPTVKPLDLMQYLVRLVTPPRGCCLDPFAGTGTTGEAAWRACLRAILIECEAEYQNDIRRRMALCLSGPAERKRESIKARTSDKPQDAGPLFAEASQPASQPAARNMPEVGARASSSSHSIQSHHRPDRTEVVST